jgi:hypothetical protein
MLAASPAPTYHQPPYRDVQETAGGDMKITIPYRIPSQNVSMRRHWSVTHKDGINAQFMIAMSCKINGIPMATGKRTIIITSVRKRLITDDANLRGGCKQLVDAIKRAGYLVDDCDTMADIRYKQKTTKQFGGRECTLIEFMTVEAGK